MDLRDLYGRAAAELRRAGALVVTAGAGMGIDSGLPDFRGDRGFWMAYPPYEKLGLSFADAANPAHFDGDPQFGWGFYGHRTNLYRSTIPHAGFGILLSARHPARPPSGRTASGSRWTRWTRRRCGRARCRAARTAALCHVRTS